MTTGSEKQEKIIPPVPDLPQSEALAGRVPRAQVEHSLAMARAAVKAAAENRGQDIILLDLTGQTALFDCFVIASGSSRRQLAAMSTEIDRVLKNEFNERRMSIAGYEESRWIVLDYGSIVVHLFDEETRGFYDLESLWADGQEVDISEIVAAASAQMAKLTE
jgi:ribosome-associated protein